MTRRFALGVKIAVQSALAVAVCVFWFPAVAFADSCHVGPPLEALGLGFHLSTSLESATYDNSRGVGNYMGIALAAVYHEEWLLLRARLPAYRLKRNDETFYGPGDLLLGTELALVRDDEETFAAGISAAVSVPTGDQSSDLGMGHFMVMPGVWGELIRDPAFIQLQVAYGRALGSHDDHPVDEHAGHHGHEQPTTAPGPIVNPMNASEIAGRLSAGYRIIGPLQVRGGVDAAVPIADDQGESRAIAVLGVDLVPDPFNLAIEGQVPFVGDPFTLKAVASAGIRF